MTEESAPEPRTGYEGWLDEIAGRRVSPLPIFMVWVPIVLTALGLAYLAGGRSEWEVMPAGALVSAIYWFGAVPVWLKRGRL